MIVFGSPWWLTSSLSRTLASLFTVPDSFHRTRWVYLVSLSTTTKMLLYTTFVAGSVDFGNLTTKSIVIVSHSASDRSIYCVCP